MSEIETYLKELVHKEVEKRNQELTLEDVEKIIQYIMPEIDMLISKRVKFHLREIAKYFAEKLGEGDSDAKNSQL